MPDFQRDFKLRFVLSNVHIVDSSGNQFLSGTHFSNIKDRRSVILYGLNQIGDILSKNFGSILTHLEKCNS